MAGEHSLFGPVDPAGDAGYDEDRPKRKGFFTDTSICIGCKACEVACKEWNTLPMDDSHGNRDVIGLSGMSYDNTGQLGANTWRHVAFVEQSRPVDLPMPGVGLPGALRHEHPDPGIGHGESDSTAKAQASVLNAEALTEFDPQTAQSGDREIRWLMSSDVCKHCTHAACLDVCPTGALFRTEFGTVVVQEDICNGCGYCVPACPFGVIDKRHIPSDKNVGAKPDLPSFLGKKEDGRVFKCTLCYDRLKGGHEPACAKACPTKSIQFGPLDELRQRADQRLEKLNAEGWNGAQLYLRDPDDGIGGAGAFFLLLDDPEVYGLPPDPQVTTRFLPEMYANMAVAAAAIVVGVLGAFLGGRK